MLNEVQRETRCGRGGPFEGAGYPSRCAMPDATERATLPATVPATPSALEVSPTQVASKERAALDLERFSVGLLALLLYLVFEAIDIVFVGFDVLHDGVGALLLLFAARCIDQPGARVYGASRWAVWVAAGTRLVGSLCELPLVSSVVPDMAAGVLALVHCGALVAVAVTVRLVCKGRGLASSARWLRVTILLLVTAFVPACVGFALGNWPEIGLPLVFTSTEGLLVAGASVAVYVLSLLALADASLATVTTLRSARRRV